MKTVIKRIIGIIVIISCLIVIAGCSNNVTPAPSSDISENTTPAPTQSPENDATPTPSASDEPTPTPTPSDEPLKRPTDIPERTVETKALEVIAQPAVGNNGYAELSGFIEHETCLGAVGHWDEDTAGNSNYDKPENLFRDTTLKLRSFEAAGLPLSMTFGASFKMKLAGYSFLTDTTEDESAKKRPTGWRLYGANLTTYEDEVLIDERTGINLPANHLEESEFFAISNPGYYQYYRLVFLGTAGNTNVVQLNSMRLYGTDGDCIGGYNTAENTDISGYTILNGLIKEKLVLTYPSQQSSDPENKAKHLFDCDITTRAWQNFQYSKDVDHLEITFVFNAQVPFDAYRFTLSKFTGAPTTWDIIGSNSSSFDTYEIMDSRENVAMPGYNYAETQVFECQKVGNYKYYMLRVYDTTFANDENWMVPEWAELTLLQKNE